MLLGRFGLGGTLKNKFEDSFGGGGQMTADFEPEATLGFELRLEKPLAKYVTAGALLSNYWYDIKGIEGFDRQYALDIAPFVKPRYPFLAGSKEEETPTPIRACCTRSSIASSSRLYGSELYRSESYPSKVGELKKSAIVNASSCHSQRSGEPIRRFESSRARRFLLG